MLGILIVKKKIITICNGLINVNVNTQSIVGIGDKLSDRYKVVTKSTGPTTGPAGLAKRSIDEAEALACQDGICAAISEIGCAADFLPIIVSFVPGPNITAVITIAISVGCKSFIRCCKKSKLLWGDVNDECHIQRN